MKDTSLTLPGHFWAGRMARGLLLMTFLAGALSFGCSEERSGIQLRVSQLSAEDVQDQYEAYLSALDA